MTSIKHVEIKEVGKRLLNASDCINSAIREVE